VYLDRIESFVKAAFCSTSQSYRVHVNKT